MEIEFDPAKDRRNRATHGVSLADAALMAIEEALVVRDERRPYGEARFQPLGLIGSRLHMLIFTMRGEVVRAISLRKANPKEVRRYHEEA